MGSGGSHTSILIYFHLFALFSYYPILSGFICLSRFIIGTTCSLSLFIVLCVVLALLDAGANALAILLVIIDVHFGGEGVCGRIRVWIRQ